MNTANKFHQQLNIVNHGNVLGGSVSYIADLITGQLISEGSVNFQPFWPVTKLIPLSSSTKIDPKMLKPSTVVVGEKIDMGTFQMTVRKVAAQKATCDLTVKGGSDVDLKGVAVLDLSGDCISIDSVRAGGKVSMFTVDLEAVRS